MNKIKKIIILFGGLNNENLVSVLTTKNLIKKIQNPICFFLNKKNKIINVFNSNINNFILKKKTKINGINLGNIDKIFHILNKKKYIILNLIHGIGSEDGEIQKKIKKKRILVTGSKIKQCNISFDKEKSKKKIKKKNTIPYKKTKNENKTKIFFKILKFIKQNKTTIIKPACNGSSIGIETINFILKSNKNKIYDIIKKKKNIL